MENLQINIKNLALPVIEGSELKPTANNFTHWFDTSWLLIWRVSQCVLKTPLPHNVILFYWFCNPTFVK